LQGEELQQKKSFSTVFIWVGSTTAEPAVVLQQVSD
jgi:hypothetical protein